MLVSLLTFPLTMLLINI